MKEMNDEQRKLVMDNYNIIYDVLKTIPHQSDHEDDLRQVAAEVLCEAAMNYDPTQGAKFSTYAYTCIRCKIIRYLRVHVPLIKPSQAVIEKREEYGYSMISFDTPLLTNNDSETRTIEDSLEDPDDHYNKFYDLLEQIYWFIDNKTRLCANSKKILKSYYYRVYNGLDYTAADVAREFNVTRAWAQNLIKRMNETLQKEYKNFL